MLYTSDIRRFAEKHPELGRVRVCARNELPKRGRVLDRPVAYIVNTDANDEEGTHWFLMFFPRFGPAEFFDSFGREPNKTFKSFLLSHSNYIFTSKCVQHFSSTTCGMHCLFYLSFHIKGVSVFNVFNHFYNSDVSYNDTLVKSYYDSNK